MRVLAFGDTHFPFMHPDAWAFLRRVKKKYKPDAVVHVGDLFDQHAFSRFIIDPNGMSPGEENRACRESVERLGNIFPEMWVCIGNHDTRIEKRAIAAGLPTECYKTNAEIFNIPPEWRIGKSWEIDGVNYFHGEGYGTVNPYRKVVMDLGMSCVVGHIHSAFGIFTRKSDFSDVFGACFGCLFDAESYAAAYAKSSVKNKGILGCGIIDDGFNVTPIRMT